jgi:hypothetical protein
MRWYQAVSVWLLCSLFVFGVFEIASALHGCVWSLKGRVIVLLGCLGFYSVYGFIDYYLWGWEKT